MMRWCAVNPGIESVSDRKGFDCWLRIQGECEGLVFGPGFGTISDAFS